MARGIDKRSGFMSSAILEEATQAGDESNAAGLMTWLGNGNGAVARAVLDVGYDAEGYFPITPSSDVGETLSKAFADGESDIAFLIGTSELAAASICTGAAICGARVLDVTSANGLLLKAEQMPAIA